MDRIAQLQDYLKIDPTDSFLQHALALEFIKTGEADRAYKMFETLLEADENYVGSYYHVAKLAEQFGRREAAIGWYEKGMAVAKVLKENHTLNELMSAYEEFVYE